MRLLFDQNLSFRLCRILADVYPESDQTLRVGLDQADDLTVWNYARREGLTIVTLDADYAEIAALRGFPPKVIWLRCGNRPTAVIEKLLRGHETLIQSFAADATAACLELY